MHTAFDWVTIVLFCCLALLFLQRSLGPRIAGDTAIGYLPPALALAVADQAGNAGWTAVAAILVVAAIGYVLAVLKPLRAS